MLDVVRATLDEVDIGAWRARVEHVGEQLGWADRRCVASLRSLPVLIDHL